MRGVNLTGATHGALTLTPRGQRYADLLRLDSEALEAMAEIYGHIGIFRKGSPASILREVRAGTRLLDRSELISALVAAEERGAV